MVEYFKCSFSGTYPPKFGINTPWPLEEPCQYPCERGVWDWVNVRGSWIPYGGTIRLVTDPAMPERVCVEFIMDALGDRPLPAAQHTKLYECQGRHTENYVEPFPTLKEAYWNLNYLIPADLNVQGWRLLWQLCGEEDIYGVQVSYPQISLVFQADDNQLGLNIPGYYFGDTDWHRFPVMPTGNIPKNRFFPITVYVKQGSSFRSLDGTVIVWIDGVKVFERHDLPTATFSGTPYVIWGVGNYGGGEELYGQNMFFKDIIVASERVTTPPTPTPPILATVAPLTVGLILAWLASR